MIVPDAVTCTVFGAAVIAGSSSVPPQLLTFTDCPWITASTSSMFTFLLIVKIKENKIQSRLDLAGIHTLHHIFTACTLDLCVS